MKKSLPPMGNPSTFSVILKGLNSPLAITLISGLFVASVTERWQANAARQERMEKSMVAFADQYGKLVNLLPTLKKRELDLREINLRILKLEADKTPIEKETTAAFNVADKKYEQALSQVNALADSNALTSQARAVFASSVIDRDCEQLEQLVDAIGLTANLSVALEDQAKALVLYKHIIQEMGSELRK